MDFIWNKPVLTFYREKIPMEKEPFAVVKALKLEVTKAEREGYIGKINAFFPLMGNLDCLSSVEGKQDHYVICWFDDNVENLHDSFRRLGRVTFTSDVAYVVDARGKRTYEAKFKAMHGKLK
jgi:protease II